MTLTEIRTYTKEIAKGLLNKIFDVQSYSLQEKKVGYWIDGRPIYKRTFDLGSTRTIANATAFNTTAGTWFNTGIDNTDMDQIIDCKFLSDNGAHYLYTTAAIDVTAYPGKVGINNAFARQITVRYITLYYTKTSDIVAGE